MAESKITRRQLERPLQQLARQLDETLPELVGTDRRVGFVLMLFDFGQGGNLAYVSNGDRAGTIAALREWLARAEVGLMTDPPGSPGEA